MAATYTLKAKNATHAQVFRNGSVNTMTVTVPTERRTTGGALVTEGQIEVTKPLTWFVTESVITQAQSDNLVAALTAIAVNIKAHVPIRLLDGTEEVQDLT